MPESAHSHQLTLQRQATAKPSMH